MPDTAAQDAYARAEASIAEQRAKTPTELDLSGHMDVENLAEILPQITVLEELRELYLDDTGITDATFLTGLTGLRILSLAGTGITDATPLAGLTGLQFLSLAGTGIADATPLAGLTGLQRLYLSNTGIADATPLAGLTDLQFLSLANTGIADATPLARLTGLEILGLNNTGIADATPLAGLTRLQTLFLANTGIADATPLAGLTGLKTLDLNGTGIADLRPLRGLSSLADFGPPIRFLGLRFADCAATRLDPHLAELAAIEDDIERTRQTLAYLNEIGDDWPSIPATAPDQDALLPVDLKGDRFDLTPSRPGAAELSDRVKRKAHDHLRERATALAQAAGNRFYALARDARGLCGDIDRDFGDLDMLDIHFRLEELRGSFERRAERTGEDAYTADVVDALDKVLTIGPGLTLDNAEVQKLEDRRDRYRGQHPTPDRIAAQDALSNAVATDAVLFGDRLRSVEQIVQQGAPDSYDRLRVGQETLNRNVVILVGTTVANGMLGGPLSAMGNQSLAWLAMQADTLTVLMPGWGKAMTVWLAPILMRAREAYQAGRHLLR